MKHKKRYAALILWSGILGVSAFLSVRGFYFTGGIMILIWAVMTCLTFINFRAYSMNQKQVRPFGSYSEIRNVDVLIVGDMIDVSAVIEEGQRYVQIKAPFSNLRSCYEIIRHTHSILNDESGKSIVVIALKKKYANQECFSVFDVPFFHRITIQKYGLERLCWLKKLPIFISPFASLIMAMNITSGSYEECECNSRGIKEFCEERGYNVKFLSLL